MAIEVQCDNCFANYRVKDDRIGTRIRCKECGSSIFVEDEDDFAPSPRRKSSKGSRRPQKRRKQQSSSNTGLLIGGGIAGVVVLVVIIVVAVKLLSKDDPQPGVADGGQGGANQAGGDGGGGAVGAWKAKAGSAPRADVIKDDVAIVIPEKAHANTVYPSTQSDFVAIGGNYRPEDIRDVWDMRNNKKVGSIHNTNVGSELGALSPDGKHFAAMAPTRDKLLLFDTAAEEQIAELTVTDGRVYPAITFAGNNRLVRIRQGQPISIWSIPSGDVENTIDAPKYLQRDSLAVSGGGKNVAFAGRNESGKQDNINIYDLDEGALAGVISLASLGLKSNPTCQGMSFSPDGSELAAVFQTYESGGKSFLIGWDMTTGEETFQHTFDNSLKGKVVLGTNSSPAVRWFPNQKWLFLFGGYVFDKKAGGPIYTLPADKERSGAVRNVISNERVVVVTGAYQKKSIKTIVLPREEITKAAAAVSSGGLAEDAGLPPLTKADSESSKTITFDGSVSSWKVQPDAGGKSGDTYLAKLIGISTPASNIGSVLMSAADTARAVVALDQGTDKAVIECYDLTNSTKLADFEVAFGCKALSLSRDGSHLLTRIKGEEGRLDVWSVPDGKHVVGWRPYQSEKGSYTKITAAEFIDANHVVTLSYGYKMTVWELPAAKALYTIENVRQQGATKSWETLLAQASRGISNLLSATGETKESDPVQPPLNPGLPAISPGGKYLALLQNDQLVLLDAATGDVNGILAVKGDLGAAAFDPTGERLAVTLSRPSGGWFTSWNLKDGKVEHEFPLPVLALWMHWCDETRLMIDNSKLIDTKQEMIVWSYETPNAIHSPQSPDGLHAALFQQSTQSQQLSLAAVRLPDAKAAGEINGNVSKPQMILEPGMKVSLQFNLTAKPPKDTGLQNSVKERLEKYFTGAGITVAASQPITVVVSTANKATGKSMTFRPIGSFGSGTPGTVINENLVICTFEVQQGGKSVWKHEAAFNNVKFGLTRLTPGETIQQHLLNKQWTAVNEFLLKYDPPSHVFPEGAKNGVGQSALTAADAMN